jgi:hypothetical protein
MCTHNDEKQNRSVEALIREATDQVYLQSTVDERLEAVRALAAMQLPVADWEQMERESTENHRIDENDKTLDTACR